MTCWLLAHELDGFTTDKGFSLVSALQVHRFSEGDGNVRINPQGRLPQCISPPFGIIKQGEGQGGSRGGDSRGDSGPYLGGEGGGEEVWSSWSEGWSEEEEEW